MTIKQQPSDAEIDSRRKGRDMTIARWSRSISISLMLLTGASVAVHGQPIAAAAGMTPPASPPPMSATAQTPSATQPGTIPAATLPKTVVVAAPAAATPSPSVQPTTVPASTTKAIIVPAGAVLAVPTGFSGTPDKQVAMSDTLSASDLDPRRMVMNAVPMVQAVMLLLAFASILSWTLLFGKIAEIYRKGRSLRGAIQEVRRAVALSDVRDVKDHVVSGMVAEARDEIDRSADMIRSGLISGLNDRAGARLQRLEDDAGRRISKGLNILATIGSITPFVGLFGTVWGIMHSFIGIAHTHTTSLAVVAPGIAEALLATSLGLLAAVPATIMYNSLGKKIVGHRARVADCIAILLCLVSRDAERAQLPVRRPQIAAQG